MEEALAGATPSEELFERAGATATEGAQPRTDNGFKVELLKRTVAEDAADVAGEEQAEGSNSMGHRAAGQRVDGRLETQVL